MDITELGDQIEALHRAGAESIEVCPQRLGAIVGGALDEGRVAEVIRTLSHGPDVEYTVHPPLRLNLMQPDSTELQRGVLDASLRFAGELGASTVVCHAGLRDNTRHARYSLTSLMRAERRHRREAGEIAAGLGVKIAVENLPPTPTVTSGETYSYSSWPAELARQLHLPPGKGTLPLGELFGEVEFPWDPTCCVELTPGVPQKVVQAALESARSHLRRIG